MQYYGQQADIERTDKIGVLLINLGTPQRPVCPSLRQYLGQFLTDPRVIELPKLFRWLLVKGIIINLRSHKSAANYRKIWTDQGSPLLTYTASLCDKVAQRSHSDDRIDVEFAMRYGQPSCQSAIKKLHDNGVRKLIVLPLYPQYSGSTVGSAFDAVSDALKKLRWVPELHFINDYHTNQRYIDAVSQSITAHWQKNGKAEKLLMSFHGVPQRFINHGDPYQAQCQQSAQLIAQNLDLPAHEWQLVFQSRFGREPWLQPYCDKTLIQLAKDGTQSIDIICPGFSADCLETLEEINQENRHLFLESGGKEFSYIPCLNDSDAHAEMVTDLINKSI